MSFQDHLNKAKGKGKGAATTTPNPPLVVKPEPLFKPTPKPTWSTDPYSGYASSGSVPPRLTETVYENIPTEFSLPTLRTTSPNASRGSGSERGSVRSFKDYVAERKATAGSNRAGSVTSGVSGISAQTVKTILDVLEENREITQDLQRSVSELAAELKVLRAQSESSRDGAKHGKARR